MGIVKKGSLLDGVSGRVGDLVLRVQGDQTIVSHRPRGKKTKRPTTETRQKTLSRFQEAVAFAKEARHRRAYRSLSRLLGRFSPYHVALQDFLSEPTIVKVDDAQVRLQGGELTVVVSEAVAVRAVRVRMPAIEEIPGEVRRPEDAAQLLANSAPQQSEEVRLPIPAALFFKRPDVGTSAAADSPRAGQELDESRRAEVSPAEIEALPSGRLGVYARRAETLMTGPGGAGHTEIWKVSLPRAGQIEIIATDYAGNSTSQETWVGPRF